MKKVFITNDFSKSTKDLKSMRPLIVAHHHKGEKGDTVTLQNIEFVPEKNFDVYYDKKKEKLVIEIELKPTDFFAIGEASGMADKKKLDVRNAR